MARKHRAEVTRRLHKWPRDLPAIVDPTQGALDAVRFHMCSRCGLTRELIDLVDRGSSHGPTPQYRYQTAEGEEWTLAAPSCNEPADG